MSEQPEKNTPQRPSSHVTKAPQEMPGHNYDPQIRAQYSNEPKVVHAARSTDESQFSVSPENQKRHEASIKQYPHLNLSDGEFVVMDVKRHLIGLLLPIVGTSIAIVAVVAAMIVYPTSTSDSGIGLPAYGDIVPFLFLLILIIAAGGSIAVWVYLQNQFYMTNESVIQEIQHSLFSRHEQTVSLGSIEDASFKQSGIFQHIFNYGTVRLSTEGEETTYRFAFVANPRNHVAVLNNAIESFKNGRPVDPYET